ncbi:CBS domain-containing protein (plasmid) [Skermanella sp. TT6]|uniref:CBS domain-containing protein n=1 Tax=Skermanella cutis TaxID=2775420 RepID=A0ABX7BG91_9PROT|nr:CBS domain-containing protein [Skermanella sp. TT6]QQP93389.1 CBS domain-containing protein [Skermanella sp. TT6]
MKAGDIMTRSVITIDADSTVAEAAKRMLEHRISGMPVVDGQGRVIGVISEGDLLRRAETGTETQGKGRGSWWLGLVAGASSQADAFTKQHGRTVRDAMSGSVISVDEDAPLNEVVELMESRRIKRVPVTRDRQVVGIISRANLMRILTTLEPGTAAPSVDDRTIRERVLKAYAEQPWAPDFGENVVVKDGVVHLWGAVRTQSQRQALVVGARTVPGVRDVVDHIDVVDPVAEGFVGW